MFCPWVCVHFAQARVVPVLFEQKRCEGLVVTFGHQPRLVQQVENPIVLIGDQIECIFIVWKLNRRPKDPLPLVLGLLRQHDVVVEESLQGLVGEIYAKLFEAVVFKAFETKDVKNANPRYVWVAVQCIHGYQ